MLLEYDFERENDKFDAFGDVCESACVYGGSNEHMTIKILLGKKIILNFLALHVQKCFGNKNFNNEIFKSPNFIRDSQGRTFK